MGKRFFEGSETVFFGFGDFAEVEGAVRYKADEGFERRKFAGDKITSGTDYY